MRCGSVSASSVVLGSGGEGPGKRRLVRHCGAASPHLGWRHGSSVGLEAAYPGWHAFQDQTFKRLWRGLLEVAVRANGLEPTGDPPAT